MLECLTVTKTSSLLKLTQTYPVPPWLTSQWVFEMLRALTVMWITVQLLSSVRLFTTPWTAAFQLSFTISQSLLRLMSTESMMPSNHLILCRPLLLLPSIFPRARVFSKEPTLHIRWPKYWSFSFSTSPSNEYSGLISFQMDWFDILAVWGTLKSLLQLHNLKTSVAKHSNFFMVQLSHPYMTAGKTIALTIWTSACKVMSLLFNMLSGLAIIFLPRSKGLWILRLQLQSAVILESKKIKSVTVFTFPHLFTKKYWDQMPWVLFFECWYWSIKVHGVGR